GGRMAKRPSAASRPPPRWPPPPLRGPPPGAVDGSPTAGWAADRRCGCPSTFIFRPDADRPNDHDRLPPTGQVPGAPFPPRQDDGRGDAPHPATHLGRRRRDWLRYRPRGRRRPGRGRRRGQSREDGHEERPRHGRRSEADPDASVVSPRYGGVPAVRTDSVIRARLFGAVRRRPPRGSVTSRRTRWAATRRYSRSMSKPTKDTPSRAAATALAPIPTNGSTTRRARSSPWRRTHHSGSSGGNVAGWGRSRARKRMVG